MCGIVTVHGEIDDDDLSRMLQRIAHRGPDDEGIAHTVSGLLGHCRLAIVDVAGGHQPFVNEDGSTFLVSNAEIYNHYELRSLVEGHEFQSRSDNEIILHLYESGDPTFPRLLNGMFAFVVAGPNGFYAARDPMGIKPLFIGYRRRPQGDTVMFASEMKALQGYVDEIQEMPAGHYFTPESGFCPYRVITDPSDGGDLLTDVDHAAAEVRTRLTAAVERQLMSDVSLGTLLSGGLDSSLIAAIAVRAGRQRGYGRLHSFVLGFSEEAGDLPAARAMADRLGTIHHPRICTVDEAFDALPEVIYHLESFDPDLVRNAVPTYLVSQLASDHVKVALSGEGADELFAGYTWYGELTPDALHRDLYRSLREMQVYNLHRVDGMSMAHSLEIRPPFLDLDFLELALSIHPSLKLRKRDSDGLPIEKWILRQAFAGDDDMPQEILWRKKAQFAVGSGATDVLKERVEAQITDREFLRHLDLIQPALRSKEELYYYRIFREAFPDRVAERAVYRWWAPDSPHRQRRPAYMSTT